MLTSFLDRTNAFFKKEENLLLFGSAALSLILLVLSERGVLPFGEVDFIFFSVLVFLASLYRPAWMFLLLVGLLPLETVSLAPTHFGVSLHPYQWWGILLLLALLVRFFGKRTPFPSFAVGRFDILLALFIGGAFLSAAVNNSSSALRMAFILGSYGILYFLGRTFFQGIRDVLAAAPFFFLSIFLTLGVGLLQNILFFQGMESMSVMPGRPNSTFSEADWFGLFLVAALASLLSLLWYFRQKLSRSLVQAFERPHFSLPLLGLLFLFVVLILTVSRSAWLGGGIVLVSFVALGMLGKQEKKTIINWRDGIFFGNVLVVTLAIAVFIVQDLGLSRFELLNRAQSTGTGLQKITLSCEKDRELPEKIESIEELPAFGCRFILLEEIASEEAAGHFIRTVLRPDPNVSIRKKIYTVAGEEIKSHLLFGIGWGNVGDILGRDERGAALNASNVYLEIWLGAGLLGLLAFLAWLILAISKSVQTYFFAIQEHERSLALFFLLSLLGIAVFNLFNSGILLGFLWVLFSLAPIIHLSTSRHEKNRD